MNRIMNNLIQGAILFSITACSQQKLSTTEQIESVLEQMGNTQLCVDERSGNALYRMDPNNPEIFIYTQPKGSLRYIDGALIQDMNGDHIPDVVNTKSHMAGITSYQRTELSNNIKLTEYTHMFNQGIPELCTSNPGENSAVAVKIQELLNAEYDT